MHNWHGEAIDRGPAGSDDHASVQSFATPGSNAAAAAAAATSTERVLAAPGFTLGNVAIYRPSCRCGEEEDWGTSPDVSTKFNSFVAASRPNREA